MTILRSSLILFLLLLAANPILGIAQSYPQTASEPETIADSLKSVCPDRDEIAVTSTKLRFDLRSKKKSPIVTLQAFATVTNQFRENYRSTETICLAAIGPDLHILADGKSRKFCSVFLDMDESGFGYGDNIQRMDSIKKLESGKQLITLSRPVTNLPSLIRLDLGKGERTCSEKTEISFLYGKGSPQTTLRQLPDEQSSRSSRFVFDNYAADQIINIELFIFGQISNEAMSGPKSWKDLEGMSLSRLTRIFGILILFAAIWVSFNWSKFHDNISHNLIFTDSFQWIALPIGLLVFGVFVNLADSLNILWSISQLNVQPHSASAFANLLQTTNPHPEHTTLNRTFAAFVWAVLVFFCTALVSLLANWATPNKNQVSEFFLVAGITLTLAAAAAAVFLLLIYGIDTLETNEIPMVYEAPAFLVSLLMATASMLLIRRYWAISIPQAIGIALLFSVTILFPSDPVLQSSGQVSIADHTNSWSGFASFQIAQYIYVTSMAIAAIKVAEKYKSNVVAATRWLLLFLGLQVALFKMDSLPSALLVIATFVVAATWLVKQTDDTIKPNSVSKTDINFGYIVGFAASAIYIFQVTFSADPNAEPEAFAMLGIMKAVIIFAIGFNAGLALSVGKSKLAGDSMTLKAIVICAYVAIINMASQIEHLRGREQLVNALTENLAVMSALIISGFIFFDLNSIPKTEEGRNWRNVFKGTTLARAVPIISALSAAIFSALSPILVNEIRDSFTEVLQKPAKQAQEQSETETLVDRQLKNAVENVPDFQEPTTGKGFEDDSSQSKVSDDRS